MIEKLRSIAVFATVVHQGTFRAAATHLGLAPSRISQTVSELEKDLGVTLLYRTTRQLSLTQEGRVLFEKAQEMLRAVEMGIDAINPVSSEPVGSLRISAPAFITQTELMGAFVEFAKVYPKVTLDLNFTDHKMDLIKDGFDLAIRAGWPEDSEFQSRKIGVARRLLVASHEYCSKRTLPQHPDDLSDWDFIRFSIRPDAYELTSSEGKTIRVSGRTNVSVNSADALYECAVLGLGISAVPENLANRGFESGTLVHLLPEWTLRTMGYHAVWPSQSRRENLTVFFVRFIAKTLS